MPKTSQEAGANCDEILKVGDVAYLYNESGKEHYVGLIKDLFENSKGKKFCTCQWFYRPMDVPHFSKKTLVLPDGGKLEALKFQTSPHELFLSSHSDVNELKSIVRKCYVYCSPQDMVEEQLAKGAYKGPRYYADLMDLDEVKGYLAQVVDDDDEEEEDMPFYFCNLSYKISTNPPLFQILSPDSRVDIKRQLSVPEESDAREQREQRPVRRASVAASTPAPKLEPKTPSDRRHDLRKRQRKEDDSPELGKETLLYPACLDRSRTLKRVQGDGYCGNRGQ